VYAAGGQKSNKCATNRVDRQKKGGGGALTYSFSKPTFDRKHPTNARHASEKDGLVAQNQNKREERCERRTHPIRNTQ